MTDSHPPKHVRDRFNNIAGTFYTTANVTVLFKGVLDDYMAGHEIDWASLVNDPLAFGAGVCCVTGSTLLAFGGGNNKKATASLGINTLANSFFLARAILLQDPASIVGSGIGLVASSYGFYTYAKATFSKEDTEACIDAESQKKQNLLTSFKENMKEITEVYPMLPVGVMNLVSSVIVGIGAINLHDTSMLIASSFWTLGSVFLGLGRPKKKLELA